MDKHKKEMITPIIITILFIAYLFFYGYVIMLAADFNPAAILLAIPLIALRIGMIYTLYT